MKEIPLTQGKIALVDDHNFDYLNQWKWHARKNGQTWYALRSISWRFEGKRYGITIAMHRDITGAENGEIVDHINGNGLDNREENLRVGSSEQNARNRRDRKEITQLIVDFSDAPTEATLKEIEKFLGVVPNVLRWNYEKRLVTVAKS